MSAFTKAFSHLPTAGATAPGRVNLLGDHTDYNLGLAMPMAIDRACTCWVSPLDEPVIRALAIDRNERSECPADLNDALRQRHQLPSWARLACGAASMTLDHLKQSNGVHLAFTSDIPPGSGLSSSAAICVSIATAIEALHNASIDPLILAKLCQRVEHEFAGVPCGLLDQLASIHGRAGQALVINFETLEVSHTPLPRRARFALINTGTFHENASGEYAKRRADCESLAHDFGVKSVRDIDFEKLESAYDAGLDHRWKRARHAVLETSRVLVFEEALATNHIDDAGEIMDLSHASLSRDYETSLPEIDALAERVRAIRGVKGCRLTGAGLGGFLVALCDTPTVLEDLQRLAPTTLAEPSAGRRALRPEEFHHRGTENTEKNSDEPEAQARRRED